MPETINIIEPTLTGEAGHCHSFIAALCKAGDASMQLCLWVGRDAELAFGATNIRVEKYFHRKVRRLQSYFLYKKLLAAPGRIFISTAGRTDLHLIGWASTGIVPPGKVFLYFHWFKTDDRKLGELKKLARKQPNLEILGPTPSVVNAFKNAGFCNAHLVPYPILRHDVAVQTQPNTFRHLLYAGAARRDKGFAAVVDLVAHLHELGLQIPVTLQTSPEHYGKYDAATRADIQRLRAIAYPHLQLRTETLGRDEYMALFSGAICLQLYDAADFSDRISGVTLDAFSAGCPIVATAKTWIANMALRFDAGAVVDDSSPAQVLSAVQRVMAEYARYSSHANLAGKTLQQENSAGILFNILAHGGNP
jgi:hypothetical protein